MAYRHAQFSFLPLVISAIVAVVIVWIAVVLEELHWFHLVLLLIVVPVAFFSRLVVTIDGQYLTTAFGFGWPSRRIDLVDVVNADIVRNSWWYGFGIRKIPNGWMYNISGLDAVELTLAKGTMFRIGTDESETLLAAVELQRSVF